MLGALIFLATYVLISARRLGHFPLGRPGAALLGAVACVAFGVVSADDALGAIDGGTILLLFGMMGIGAFLDLDGFSDRVEAYVARNIRTRRRLLALIVWSAGAASAVLTNDAVCVLGAPIVVAIVRAHRLPASPYLLGLATASNTGSVATLVGNPQNMLCASLGNLDYRHYAATMLPVAIVGLAVNHAVLVLVHRRELEGDLTPRASKLSLVDRRIGLTLGVIALTTALYSFGLDLAWSAVAGFTLLLIAHRRDATEVWPRIDWSVLLFFASLFIVVAGLGESGAPAWLFERFPLAGSGDSVGASDLPRLSTIFLVGANVVSNVPFILVVQEQMATLPDPRLGWQVLAMASTFAGNLTLLGSVANIIVAERGRDVGGLGFVTYLKVGLPVAVITTTIGTAWLMALSHPW